jgi:hypothetical protein
MMSDVAFARASWPIKILYLAICYVVVCFEKLPVVITRARYNRLRDNELMLDAAHRAIAEAHRLRQKYEPTPEVIHLNPRGFGPVSSSDGADQ